MTPTKRAGGTDMSRRTKPYSAWFGAKMIQRMSVPVLQAFGALGHGEVGYGNAEIDRRSCYDAHEQV